MWPAEEMASEIDVHEIWTLPKENHDNLGVIKETFSSKLIVNYGTQLVSFGLNLNKICIGINCTTFLSFHNMLDLLRWSNSFHRTAVFQTAKLIVEHISGLINAKEM